MTSHALAIFVFLATLSSCGREEAHQRTAAAASQADATGAASAPNADASSSNNGEENSGSSSGSDKTAPTATPDKSVPISGKDYYSTVVAKLFDAACSTCHADPRANPDIRGPLTIFSYAAMKAMLDGSSAVASTLMQKVHGVTAHSGGDRCQSAGLTGSPCKEIATWWRLEKGADSGLAGELSAISDAGTISGYALNVNDTAAALGVDFMVDGAKVLTLTANQDGFDGGYDGNHAFTGLLPATLRDGKPHDISATTTLAGKTLPLGAAVHFTAYTPTAAGKAFFVKTVAPAMTACKGCHVIQYETQYASLIEKTPAAGGTVTDNALINHGSGSVTHPGGNVCGSKSGAPCNLFQQWWALEFK